MKQLALRILLLTVLVAVTAPASASRIPKAFEALEVLDYFQAKKLFKKGLKYNPAASSYGLSII